MERTLGQNKDYVAGASLSARGVQTVTLTIRRLRGGSVVILAPPGTVVRTGPHDKFLRIVLSSVQDT